MPAVLDHALASIHTFFSVEAVTEQPQTAPENGKVERHPRPEHAKANETEVNCEDESRVAEL